MQKDKWIFYTDLFGRQRWERFSAQGNTIAESETAFESLADAILDASTHGYELTPEEGTLALEWRVKSLDTSPVACERQRCE